MKYSKHGYKRNSKDRNNPYNVIPSGNITMEGVDFPVMGTDNLGNQKLMMPGANYVFPGNTVFEVPLAQKGGSLFKAQYAGEFFEEPGVIGDFQGDKVVNPKDYEGHIIMDNLFKDANFASNKHYLESVNPEEIDITEQKNFLLAQFNSPLMRDRMREQYKLVTGEYPSDEELDTRIASQIAYIEQGPDFALQYPYTPYKGGGQGERFSNIGPIVNVFGGVNTYSDYYSPMGSINPYSGAMAGKMDFRNSNISNYRPLNPNDWTAGDIIKDKFSNRLGQLSGLKSWEIESEMTNEEVEALARKYNLKMPNHFKYPWMFTMNVNKEGDRVYRDSLDKIITHELGHTFNTDDSPLFQYDRKFDNQDRPYNRSLQQYDFSAFDEIGATNNKGEFLNPYQNYIMNDLFGGYWSEENNPDQDEHSLHHEMNMPEISSAKQETLKELYNKNLWDVTGEIPFGPSHLDNMLNANFQPSLRSEAGEHLDAFGYYDLIKLTNDIKSQNRQIDINDSRISRAKSDLDEFNNLSRDEQMDFLSGIGYTDFDSREFENNYNKDKKEKHHLDFDSAMEILQGKKQKGKKYEAARKFIDDFYNQSSQEYLNYNNNNIRENEEKTNEYNEIIRGFEEEQENIRPSIENKLDIYFNKLVQGEDTNNEVYAKYGGSLPKAQAGFDMLQNHQIAAQLREKGIDPDAKGSDLSPFSDVPPTGGVSNLLDILSIPGNLMAEVFEGVGNYGDKEFNFKDAMPGFSGDFSFTNMYDEPTKTVAGVTDVQGFVPSLLVNIFTDPTSYIGAGLLGKAGTVTKGASKTSKVINATDDLAVASKNTPTNITKPAAETVHTPGSVHDYLTKYWNDPKFQKYQTTEMVRNARQYNDDMMMRNLYFKQRQDGVDLALKYGHNHPIVQNYHKNFVDPYPTHKSFMDNFKPTLNDKINYRSSFNDIINRQTRFGNQNIDFLNQKFKPRTFDELMDPKLLNRNYFNLLFDKMRTPIGESSFQTFKSWMKDNRKTLGLYYGKNPSRYLSDKIYIKDMLTSPGLLATKIKNPTAYSDQIKSTKIHEWSHYLDKSGTTYSNKQLDDLSRLADPFTRMKINDEKLYGTKLAKDYFYYTKPTEIKARMMELRNNFNLLPSDKFTMEHLKKSGDMFGMRPYISVDDRPELFLDIMNKYYREGGEKDVDFDQLERGIRYAESLNGELMKNPKSSASGLYQQLFDEIEYEGTRDQFIEDIDYQKELFKKRAYGEMKDVPGLISNGMDLYSEYQDQLDLTKYGLNPLTIAGLSNMLGRQGTRKYIGNVLRDGKTIEEVFPHLYGEDAKYPNHTPEEYITKFNKGLITKKEGGSTLRKIRRIKQQLNKYKEGKEISYIAKKELINLGLIDNALTSNKSVR